MRNSAYTTPITPPSNQLNLHPNSLITLHTLVKGHKRLGSFRCDKVENIGDVGPLTVQNSARRGLPVRPRRGLFRCRLIRRMQHLVAVGQTGKMSKAPMQFPATRSAEHAHPIAETPSAISACFRSSLTMILTRIFVSTDFTALAGPIADRCETSRQSPLSSPHHCQSAPDSPQLHAAAPGFL